MDLGGASSVLPLGARDEEHSFPAPCGSLLPERFEDASGECPIPSSRQVPRKQRIGEHSAQRNGEHRAYSVRLKIPMSHVQWTTPKAASIRRKGTRV